MNMQKKNVLDDLDRMLNKQSSPEEEVELGGHNQEQKQEEEDLWADNLNPYSWPAISVKGTSVNVVAVLIDDSGSVYEIGGEEALKSGIKDMVSELQNTARSKKETFLALVGFKQQYFIGDVLDVKTDDLLNEIMCTHGKTPLTTTAYKLARTVEAVEKDANKNGLEVVVNILVLTDGKPDLEFLSMSDFKAQIIEQKKHWRFLGVGLSNKRDLAKNQIMFTDIFTEMGVNKIITPTPENLRATLCEFSKSVSLA